MQILARYIASSFFKNLMISIGGLTVLFFFQKIVAEVNDFTLSQRIIMNLYEVPKLWVMVAPPGVLTATVLTLSALSRTNELTACFSIGVGIRQIMSLLFPIVFVLCCALLILQDRIIPAFNEKQNAFYWKEIKKRQDFYLDVKQEKIWYRSNRYIYHLRNFDPEKGRIFGIGVYSFDDEFNLREEIQAVEAQYRGGYWELKDGKSILFPQNGGFPVTERFQTRELRIKESPRDFKVIEREVDRLRIKDLLRFIRSNRESGINSRGLEVKLHSRFALSFMPIVMFLLAIPFAVSRAREGRTGRDLAIAFGFTFLYWLGYSVTSSLGQSGALPPAFAAWCTSVLFGAIAVLLLKRMRV